MCLHISDMKLLRGKFRIWLPCKSHWDAGVQVSYFPHPFSPSLLQPYFSLLPPTCVSTSQKHYLTRADGYIALDLSTTYKSIPWTCHSHAGSNRGTTFRSWLWSVSSCLTIILRFRSSVDSDSWNYHLFHQVVCMIFVMVLFFYWVLRS